MATYTRPQQHGRQSHVQRRLHRSPGDGCPIFAIALPIESDRVWPVRGNELAQGMHAARRPGRLIALMAGQFRLEDYAPCDR